MSRIRDFLNRIFRPDRDDSDLYSDYVDMGAPVRDTDADSESWDWEHIVEERHLYRMSDELQREKYLRSLVEQVKNASNELDVLSYEYNSVTATLKDMDELDSLPKDDKADMIESAKQVLHFEKETSAYTAKQANITNDQYRIMERYEKQLPKAYEEMKEAEHVKVLVKNDLAKLDGEKQAYLYREEEAQRDIGNFRGMTVICLFAAALCLVMLLILQYGFEMDTGIGYMMVVLGAAIGLTVIYVKHMDAVKELGIIQRGINKLILLQNTVKIRYVNNKNLLDYMYIKYNVMSSGELKKRWEAYTKEKSERERQARNEEELSFHQTELLRKLRRYRLNDVYAWLHNPLAIVDKREMVELRHMAIVQRQKLRARMDYNKKLGLEGQKELKEFVKQYPQYSNEALDMVDKYSNM